MFVEVERAAYLDFHIVDVPFSLQQICETSREPNNGISTISREPNNGIVVFGVQNAVQWNPQKVGTCTEKAHDLENITFKPNVLECFKKTRFLCS